MPMCRTVTGHNTQVRAAPSGLRAKEAAAWAKGETQLKKDLDSADSENLPAVWVKALDAADLSSDSDDDEQPARFVSDNDSDNDTHSPALCLACMTVTNALLSCYQAWPCSAK
jgi:hypothetical protein